MDKATQQSLEITQTIRARDREGSLLSVIDQTKTPMGARLLREWIISPLRVSAEIKYRQIGVKELSENSPLMRELRDILGNIYDIERISTKISCGRANARDLVSSKTLPFQITCTQRKSRILYVGRFSIGRRTIRHP